MPTETNNNPFENIFQFYIDQADKLTPVIKQGIDDWFTVYNKIWKEGMQLQSKLIHQWTGNAASTKYSEHAKDLGEKIIGIQKELSSNMINISMQGVKSFMQAAKKSKV